MPMHLHLARLAAALALAGSTHAQLTVTAVSPARQERAAPTATTVAITFATPLLASSVHARSCRVWGRWSGLAAGTLTLVNGGTTVAFQPSRPFFPGEMVTVMLSNAVQDTSGRPLTGGHMWSFWVRSVRGTGAFTRAGTFAVRQPGEGPIQTYGAYAGDLDRDGAPDLSLPNEGSADLRVVPTDGCGVLSYRGKLSLPAGSRPSTNEGQDFDGDGVADLALGMIGGQGMAVFLGDGLGSYLSPVIYPSGNGTRGLAVLDADGDGDVDVVTANRASSNLALHRNNGDGTFQPASLFEGGGNGETAVTAADADGDGIADLFVGCYGSGTVTLLLGDGAGGFTLAATASTPANPWMIATGDIDGDGNADAVTCHSGPGMVAVVRGNGAGGLSPAATVAVGSFPLAIDVGDLDGDGDLDAVSSNFQSASFTVLRNDGSGAFPSRTTLPSQQAGSCALLVDYDRDGDVDVLGIDEVTDVVLLFPQDGPNPPLVQAPACAGTLRADNLAGRGGYGGAALHPVPIGSTLLVGITATPLSAYTVVVGLALEPGLATALGRVNLAPQLLVALPAGQTDAFGEGSVSIPVPQGLTPGTAAALQAVVADSAWPGGWRVTNPEGVVLQ